MESKEAKQLNSLLTAKVRMSKLAIASFASCVLAILCMVIYLYYEEAFISILNHFFLNHFYPAYFDSDIFEKICLMLPAISVLLGIAAVIRIALSSKRRKGYILAIVSIILVLIASFLCAIIAISKIGPIC
jgi:multisubunit Na+/H+ antiporter MnhB subunit